MEKATIGVIIFVILIIVGVTVGLVLGLNKNNDGGSTGGGNNGGFGGGSLVSGGQISYAPGDTNAENLDDVGVIWTNVTTTNDSGNFTINLDNIQFGEAGIVLRLTGGTFITGINIGETFNSTLYAKYSSSSLNNTNEPININLYTTIATKRGSSDCNDTTNEHSNSVMAFLELNPNNFKQNPYIDGADEDLKKAYAKNTYLVETLKVNDESNKYDDFTELAKIGNIATKSDFLDEKTDVGNKRNNIKGFLQIFDDVAGDVTAKQILEFTKSVKDGEIISHEGDMGNRKDKFNNEKVKNRIPEKLDKTHPTLDVNIVSDNENTNRAKLGNIITLTMNFSKDISQYPTPTFKIGERESLPFEKVDDTDTVYKYTVTEETPEGLLRYSIPVYKDLSLNPGETVTDRNSGITVDKTSPILESVKLNSNNTIYSSKAGIGKVIILDITTSEKIKETIPTVTFFVNDVELTGGTSFNILEANKRFRFTNTVAEGYTPGTVNFSITGYTDLAGNNGVEINTTTNGSSVEIDTSSPVIITGELTHDRGDNTVLITGTVVTLTFSSNKELKPDPEVKFTIDGSELTTELTTENNINYTCTYTILETDNQGVLGYKISNYFDQFGNLGTEVTEENTGLTVNPNLQAPTMIVTVGNNNPNPDGVWAKSEDTITLTMEPDQAIKQPSVVFTIGSDTVTTGTLTAGDNNSYIYTYTIVQGDTGDISYTIEFESTANIPGNTIDNTTGITVDTIAPTMTVTVKKNDLVPDGVWAKLEDTITLNMIANENIQQPAVVFTIDGTEKTGTLTPENNSDTYTYTYTVAGGDTGDISYTIDYQDPAGNPGDQKTGPVATITVDTTLPVLTNFNITSTGEGNTLETNNTATLTFVSSEQLNNSPTVTFIVNDLDRDGTVTNIGNDNDYTAEYTIAGDDTSGVFGYRISDYQDQAGNSGETVTVATTDYNVVIPDTTPPTLDEITLSSNNTDPTKATTGNTITLNIVASEEIQQPTVVFTIDGTEKTGSFGDTSFPSQNFNYTYDVTEGDNGPVDFSISGIKDTSDNSSDQAVYIDVTDESFVTVDATLLGISHSITTSNDDTTLAKLGDTITLTITPTEPINQPTVSFTLGGHVLSTNTTQDGDNWITTYKLRHTGAGNITSDSFQYSISNISTGSGKDHGDINNTDNDIRTDIGDTIMTIKSIYLEGVSTIGITDAKNTIENHTDMTTKFHYSDVTIDNSSDPKTITVVISRDISGNPLDPDTVVGLLDVYNSVATGEQIKARCEITVDEEIYRKDYYVKTTNFDAPYYKFFEKYTDANNNTNDLRLDLNYESTYKFIGAHDLSGHPFKIGVYPDTQTDSTDGKIKDIWNLIKFGDDTDTDTDSDGNTIHFSGKHKVFINPGTPDIPGDADSLSSMKDTAIDTLEWDGDGTVSGSNKSLTGITSSFEIKLIYKPINYLGHKTMSRLFYRCGIVTHRTMNGQILISTPLRVVKLFDYSILDIRFDQSVSNSNASFKGKVTWEHKTGNIDVSNNNRGSNFSESLLELDAREGRNLRYYMAKTFERIERLFVYSDKVKEKIKYQVTNPYRYGVDVAINLKRAQSNYNDYLANDVIFFEDKDIWKGFHCLYLDYGRPNSGPTLAYAGNYSNLNDNFDKPEQMSIAFFWDKILENNNYINDEERFMVDVITHEVLHGLGIIPARRKGDYPGLINETKTALWAPTTHGDFEFNLDKRDVNNMYFYSKVLYPHAWEKYKEYRNEAIRIYNTKYLDKTDIPANGDIVYDVNFNPQENGYIPLENAGDEGTAAGHWENYGYENNDGIQGTPDKINNFYLGIFNELMVGGIGPTELVISGITLGISKSLVDNDGVNIFKVLRDDGEVLPFETTDDTVNNTNFTFTQDDINKIPWNKDGLNNTSIPLQFSRIRDANTGKISGYVLLFNFTFNLQHLTDGSETENTDTDIIIDYNSSNRNFCGCDKIE